MNIRKIFTTVTVLATLAASQAAMAGNVAFYQKASEATAPITGNVAMRLTVDADGGVHNVRVVRSSGSISIDNSAVEWLEGQKMKPAFVNGQAQEFSFVKEFKYSETGSFQQASLK